MIRILTTFSALAMAAAIALPASAETEIHVKLTGKTAAEAYAAIAQAARTVCRGADVADPHGLFVADSCVADTVETAIAKVKSPALNQYARTREAYLQLASN